MPYTYIKDFRNGVDRRRRQSASDAGILYELINGHLTRGGDVEQAKSFVSKYTLPSGTFGLWSLGSALYVFGSIADPGVPAGVTYQRLQHPGGAVYSMTDIVDIDNFNGAPYVVAEFSDGEQYHFWNGTQVYDWNAGLVRAYMTNNDGIATHLKNVIDADDDYSATVSTNQVTITGPIGEDFEVVLTTEDGGGTDDQTLTSSVTQTPIAAVAEQRAAGSFSILGGSVGGSNLITDVSVGGTALLNSASVAWVTNNSITAANVASDINDAVGTHGYEASAVNGVVYLYAPYGDGQSANARTVQVTVTGDIIISNSNFAITGGTNSTGVNIIDSIKADGVELLNSASVDWATSNSTTAAAVATDIRAASGTSGYTAFAKGETVYVSPLVSSSDDGEVTLLVTTGGDVTVEAGTAPSTPTPDSDKYERPDSIPPWKFDDGYL